MLIYLPMAYGCFCRELSRYEGGYMAYKDKKKLLSGPLHKNFAHPWFGDINGV